MLKAKFQIIHIAMRTRPKLKKVKNYHSWTKVLTGAPFVGFFSSAGGMVTYTLAVWDLQRPFGFVSCLLFTLSMSYVFGWVAVGLGLLSAIFILLRRPKKNQPLLGKKKEKKLVFFKRKKWIYIIIKVTSLSISRLISINMHQISLCLSSPYIRKQFRYTQQRNFFFRKKKKELLPQTVSNVQVHFDEKAMMTNIMSVRAYLGDHVKMGLCVEVCHDVVIDLLGQCLWSWLSSYFKGWI